MTGCAQSSLPQSLPQSRSQSQPEADLKLQVEPAGPGIFAIAGQTNLPDNTQMRVMAIRQLQPTQPVAAAQPTYTILAYESVRVEQGQWQTKLNLWETAPDGSYRESWQLEAARLNLAVTPQSEVQFVATLAPQGVLASLEEQLRSGGLRLPQSLLRTTLEGEQFLQVEQSVAVNLPQGKTTPPIQRPEDLNDGWGERYLLVEEPPLPYTLKPEDERKTDAPANIEEYLF
ncbi:MAG TPA: hypothetical protein V6D29_25785 [Leptolyngbyaceae cyanobacterium]